MTKLKLDAEKREATRARVKPLRATGMVPVVVYGKGIESQNLQIAERNLSHVLTHGGTSQLVELNVAGGPMQNVLVREVQRHPVHHRLLHVDLYAVRMDEKQKVEVPINGVGKPLAMASDVMVLQNRESILIEALPVDLPTVIEVDITGLSLEHAILVSNLPNLPGVTYLADENEHVYSMLPVGAGADEKAGEGATAEPEVVKKGKQDEEE
ncbi:MAG: 50S ribosomal protein L25 [Caldilineaceae bacterium]